MVAPRLSPVAQNVTQIFNTGSASVQRRHSPAEAPPIGKIQPFSKMAVIFEPPMWF